MNIKNSLVKSIGFAGVVSALSAAYAFVPAKVEQVAPPVEQVAITAPFKLESINVKKSFAAVETLNEQYVVEFEYVASKYPEGNGLEGGSFDDVYVKEIKEPHVYDENGEVANYYLDNLDIQEIVQVIEQELRERI